MIAGQITYGPHGASFAVWQGDRVVQRHGTEEAARVGATRWAAVWGGEVGPREPRVLIASEPDAQGDGGQPPPDFHLLLDLPIGKIRERLSQGDLDEHLVALDAAERGATTRKPRIGALDAIADRIQLVTGHRP